MYKKPKKELELWLINKSMNQDIGVDDLGIRICKGQRINLLKGNYNFGEKEIRKSAESGSIYKKSNTLVLQEKKPQELSTKMMFDITEPRILKPIRHANIDNSQPYYAELDIDDDILGMTDEEFALEQADAATNDRAPDTEVTDKILYKKQ